jgi:hypothetical protein
VGSCGFLIREHVAEDRPFASLRRMLANGTGTPVPFGRGESAARFLVAQTRMQWRKRRRPGTVPGS